MVYLHLSADLDTLLAMEDALIEELERVERILRAERNKKRRARLWLRYQRLQSRLWTVEEEIFWREFPDEFRADLKAEGKRIRYIVESRPGEEYDTAEEAQCAATVWHEHALVVNEIMRIAGPDGAYTDDLRRPYVRAVVV